MPDDTPRFDKPWAMTELMEPFLDALERRQRAPHGGVHSTGFVEVDALTGGGNPRQLWIVRGGTRTGKTAFTLGIAATPQGLRDGRAEEPALRPS